MAGILNPKARIMDLMMTQEGKRQLAAGDFKVSYASFTDRGTFYDKSSISGSYDSAVNRPYFEVANYPFDSITVEANDQGNVLPTGVGEIGTTADRFVVADGKITKVSTKTPVLNDASFNSRFATYVDDIIRSTTQNFRKQRIIASRDPVDDSSRFVLSNNEINLPYSNLGPIVGEDLIPLVDQAPTIFTHKRFSNAINFQYLPPVVQDKDEIVSLGEYPNVKSTDQYTYDDLMSDLNGSDPENPVCPRESIRFVESSQTNDICFQIFEMNRNNLKKLEIVDFGEFYDPDDTDHPEKRVFFVGKVFVDSYGNPTYANIFTLVLD